MQCQAEIIRPSLILVLALLWLHLQVAKLLHQPWLQPCVPAEQLQVTVLQLDAPSQRVAEQS